MYEAKMIQRFNGHLSQALERLTTEKQRRFVMEYGLDYDSKRAYKVVYSATNRNGGLAKLLKNPSVKRCMNIIR